MLVAVLSLLPFISTTLGGLTVLRLRHRLHPIMGFAAGAVVTTALADLLPEAIELTAERAVLVGGAAACGFLAFSALDAVLHKQSWEHQHPAGADPNAPHEHGHAPDHDHEPLHDGVTNGHGSALSLLGSAGLIVHSLLDGLAIGVGFQASDQVGALVLLAVLAHDFADGMNVVTLALTRGRGTREAVAVLALDALAPVIGVAIGSVISVSDQALGVLLATFAGVFIAIGAGHLLPEAQHQKPGEAPLVVLMAALGAIVVLFVRSFAPG